MKKQPQPSLMTLEELLLTFAPLDDFQKRTATSFQKKWGGDLCHIFLELKFITEEDVANLISEKCSIPRIVGLCQRQINSKLAAVLPLEFVQKYNCIPLEFLQYSQDTNVKDVDKELVLTCFDPLNKDMRRILKEMLPYKLFFSIATKSEILECISNRFLVNDHYMKDLLERERLLFNIRQGLSSGLITSQDLVVLAKESSEI